MATFNLTDLNYTINYYKYIINNSYIPVILIDFPDITLEGNVISGSIELPLYSIYREYPILYVGGLKDNVLTMYGINYDDGFLKITFSDSNNSRISFPDYNISNGYYVGGSRSNNEAFYSNIAYMIAFKDSTGHYFDNSGFYFDNVITSNESKSSISIHHGGNPASWDSYYLPDGTNKGYALGSNIPTSYTFTFTTELFYKTDQRQNFWTEVFGRSKVFDSDDPNGGGGNSTGGGGGGDGDIGGSPHETGTLPTITALDSGLMTLYNPTVSELQSLGRFLWSDAFSLDTFKKLFNDPFDTLLGLSIIPVKPNVSGAHNIIFGNLDTGIYSSIIGNQFVEVDCGSFTLNEVWNGSLDYSPYTEVSIYLPFIGVRQLNCNDVMGSVLHLYYRFDVLTGSVIAEITVNHSEQGNKSNGFSYNADMGSVYTFEGQCSVNVPLSSQDFTNTIRAAISAVGMVAGATASLATGNPALGVAALAVGSANAVTQSMTPTVERSGHLSSSASMLASLEPCLFVTRPHQCKPQRYYALRGVPSQVYVSKLSSCTGFFQISDVQNIHASGASDVELQELKQILTQGVFVNSWS